MTVPNGLSVSHFSTETHESQEETRDVVLSGSALRLIHALADGVRGVVFLAETLGLSERHIQRLLHSLAEAGYILPVAHTRGGRGHATEYIVAASAPTKRVTSTTPKGDIDKGERVTSSVKGDMAQGERVTWTDPMGDMIPAWLGEQSTKGDIPHRLVHEAWRGKGTPAQELRDRAMERVKRLMAERTKGDIARGERVTSSPTKGDIDVGQRVTSAAPTPPHVPARTEEISLQHGQSVVFLSPTETHRREEKNRPTPAAGTDPIPGDRSTPRVPAPPRATPSDAELDAILRAAHLTPTPDSRKALREKLLLPCPVLPTQSIYRVLSDRAINLTAEAERAYADRVRKHPNDPPMAAMIGIYFGNFSRQHAQKPIARPIIATR